MLKTSLKVLNKLEEKTKRNSLFFEGQIYDAYSLLLDIFNTSKKSIVIIDNYISKAGSFACCARYEECSDAKKCLHPNQLYSTACAYRKNLENNKIFYGKNNNIEE